MKVIASTGSNTFLVEANKDELARCQGFPYDSSAPSERRVQIGYEFNPSEAYALSQDIIGSSKELNDAAEKVKKVLLAIENLRKNLVTKAQIVQAKMPRQ